MVDAETKRRLDIINQITDYLEKQAGPIVSSRVVGSMSFAQNHAIRADSDIDLDIFVPFSELVDVNPFVKFLNGNVFFDDDVSWQEFDLIAVDCVYKGVAVNLWVINTITYKEIANFTQGYLRYFSVEPPSEDKEFKLFGGGTCMVHRDIRPFKKGNRSERETLYEGRVISENYVLNNMFLMSPIFGAAYSNQVVNEMWSGFLGKYPNASAEQLLDFIHDRVSARFSPAFKEKLDNDIRSRLSANQTRV